jgi:hypothetical protein
MPDQAFPAGTKYRVVFKDQNHCVEVTTSKGAPYLAYYNEARAHLSLGKDTSIHRPIQRFGRIVSAPILGGLHHRYCRI